jgi:hypothetical protein
MNKWLSIFERLTRTPEVERPFVFYDAALNRDAPFGQWRHLRAFDSAEACERMRLRLSQSADKTRREFIFSESTTESDVRQFKVAIAALSARCLPTAVVYPPAR